MHESIRPSGAPDRDFLLLAFEASSDCVAMLDCDATVLVINASGAVSMGFDSPGAPLGQDWVAFWSEADRDGARSAFAAATRGERSSFRALRAASGRQTHWDSIVLALPGPNGRPDRLLALSRNVTEQYEAEQAFARSVRLQQALIEATSEIVWHVDLTTGRTVRRGYVEFTGKQDDPNDMDGWLAAVHPSDRDRAKATADEAEAAKGLMLIEYRLLHKTGGWRWVEDQATPLINEQGVVTDWVGIITDIHDRKSAEQAMRKSAEHLRLAVEATGLGTWDVDVRTGQRDWSPEMFDILGLPRNTRPDRRLYLDSIYPEDRARAERELVGSKARSDRKHVSVFRIVLPCGTLRWVEAHERTFFDDAGKSIRRVGTLQDVTARKQADHEVWQAAHTDALTGIANRALFNLRLEEAVETATADGTSVALLLVDLDRFKEINDTLGHDAGDTLLRTVAERLRLHVEANSTVARLGGDEFGVIFPAVSGLAEPETYAATLLAALEEPLTYSGREVDCSASIGWSVFPDHDEQASALLKNADVALYAAKSAGRSRAMAFTPAMRDELARRINVLRQTKDALLRNAVVPFYQPKVSLETGRVVGFEALLRWSDGTTLRSPNSIQEAFDDPELSVKLGARMLASAVTNMVEWTADNVPFGHVALNVATPEFQGKCYSERIFAALDSAGLRSSQLKIEVTERVLLDDGGGAIGTALGKLHDAGVLIALDDFGTGYASLTHLTKFPVTWVKIDRSFIANPDENRSSAAIVRAVIALAHNIGIKIVAEGVETDAQLTFLSKAGCDLGQGFLLAKPMSGSRVPYFLKHWNSRWATLSAGGSDDTPAPVRRARKR